MESQRESADYNYMKNSVLCLFILSLLLILASCAKTPLKETLTSAQSNQLEKIYNVDIKPGVISFVVRSHGCTLNSDFKLLQQSQGREREFALLRLKQDRCRAMPRAFPVTFSLDKPITDKSKVQVINPRKPCNRFCVTTRLKHTCAKNCVENHND